MNGINSVIAAINAGSSKGISPSYLSKLWLVSEKLTKGVLDFSTHLCHHSSDNIMHRQFTTNDRILWCKCLLSVFYTDAMVTTPKDKSKKRIYLLRSPLTLTLTMQLIFVAKETCKISVTLGSTNGSTIIIHSKERLGCALGPTQNEGHAMTQAILTSQQ